MTNRARRGLEAFLKRKAAVPTEDVSALTLRDSRELTLRIRRHPTARRLTLRIAPDGSEARVSIPRWAPFGEGRAFAASRIDWLTAQLPKVPQPEAVGAGSALSFRGRDLVVTWRPDLPRSPAIVGDALQLGGPADNVSRRVQRWLEAEAIALMRADLAYYCDAAGMAAPDIRLSRAQRRWGSCSTSGTIRVNWRLVMAPDHVRRSVVAHEVAHLAHFDHSPAFHAFLASIYEHDIAVADRWLKRHGRSLHAPFG